MHCPIWPSSVGWTVVDLAGSVKIPQLTGWGIEQTADKVGMLGTARRKVLGNSLAKSSADDYILADRRGRLTIELSVDALDAR